MMKREKVDRGPVRFTRTRIVRVKPDPSRPYVVEVLISPTLRHMQKTIQFHCKKVDRRCDGMVRSFHYRRNDKGRALPRFVLAVMYLNSASLRENGDEILSHECVHAGMAWARFVKAELGELEGEEIMAYAVGRLHRQLKIALHQLGL